MAKICAFCGAPSGMYPLCKKCFNLREEGKIAQCPDCNSWYWTDEGCKCKAVVYKVEKAKEKPSFIRSLFRKKDDKQQEYKQDDKQFDNNLEEVFRPSHAKQPIIELVEAKTMTIDSDKPLSKCIICHSESNGFLFCKSCYYKYKNKVLFLKISKCTDIDLLDESYEGKYTCTDGHIVKSKSERDIDNYLYQNKIPHAYEKAYITNDGTELRPDFYLSSLDAYIEHWGFDESNKAYTETKEFKIKHYEKDGATVICTYENKDTFDINAALDRKLKTFKKGIVNFK